MSNEWKPHTCIYHANCADGFGAAWAVWMRFGDAVEYIPASYDDAPPDVAGKHVLLVDYSYKLPVLLKLAEQAASIIILDHHQSAEAELQTIPRMKLTNVENVWEMLDRQKGNSKIMACRFDMDTSGAVLAWEFCHPGTEIPLMLRYIEDRDLWRFKLQDSRAVNAALAATMLDFDDCQKISRMVDIPEELSLMVAVGRGIILKQENDIEALLAATTREIEIDGVKVPGANVPFMWASEAGHILAQAALFSVTYFDMPAGRKFSLRSSETGADVAVIAAKYGGGGHKHAAGFTTLGRWSDVPSQEKPA